MANKHKKQIFAMIFNSRILKIFKKFSAVVAVMIFSQFSLFIVCFFHYKDTNKEGKSTLFVFFSKFYKKIYIKNI